ncbi:hypothetical protein TD95_000011 [Thielaviopsis punctulata]|uniref:Uncharacterized protein n=1 Tax=Thielaviopsis punctulata TaxID=72032 RepID=A0A0F4Z7B3_9PEZI|nr:hypothetical protein TD95_000011 [Thielaviopsis punctulata]
MSLDGPMPDGEFSESSEATEFTPKNMAARAYQLEMLKASMNQNIIVARRLRDSWLISKKDGYRKWQDSCLLELQA